jgi:hypothetical protein
LIFITSGAVELVILKMKWKQQDGSTGKCAIPAGAAASVAAVTRVSSGEIITGAAA